MRRNIVWDHIPEKAAWFGVFYERLVGPVKNCLKKSLGKARLDFNELLTVLHEIELILNSKPLTYMSDDASDDVLTPNHILFGRRLPLTNEIEGENAKMEPRTGEELTEKMRNTKKLIDNFWDLWRKDYLLSLRENMRPHSNFVDVKPKVDDIVIVHEDKVPRYQWNMGRIIEVEKSSDGQIRSARVMSGKTGNVVRRPINKLYPLVK